jgi:hypothetical protein
MRLGRCAHLTTESYLAVVRPQTSIASDVERRRTVDRRRPVAIVCNGTIDLEQIVFARRVMRWQLAAVNQTRRI